MNMAEAGKRVEIAAGQPLRFWGVAYAACVLIAGTNLPTPLYESYQHKFGITSLTIALLVVVYAAVTLPSSVLWGPLADRLGARRVVMPALIMAMVGAWMFASATSAAWLYGARVLQGLAVGAALGPLMAVLVQTEPSGSRARASLLGTVTTTVGAGLGPILAGALAEYAPWPLRLSYLVEIILLLVAVPCVMRIHVQASRPGGWRPRPIQVPVPIRRQFAHAATVGMLSWAAAYVVLALVPSYAARSMHNRNLLVGGCAAGLLLVCSAAAQFAARALDPDRAQAQGLALLGLGLLGLVLAGLLGSTTALLGTMVVAGAGHGLGYFGALQKMNIIAPGEERAGVASAFFVVSYLGSGITVGITGVLTVWVGLVAAVQAVAVGLAAASLAALRTRPRPDQFPAG